MEDILEINKNLSDTIKNLTSQEFEVWLAKVTTGDSHLNDKEEMENDQFRLDICHMEEGNKRYLKRMNEHPKELNWEDY